MTLEKLIKEKNEEIKRIAAKHGANNIRIFGSVVRDEIGPESDVDLLVDVGPETIAQYTEILDLSRTVLWNGPVGVFEIPQFSIGTESIARKLAEITEKGTITVVGGGDSAAAIKKFGLTNKVTHVSTGGGASLELLSGLELIPITLITKK